jgi:hypothetical protein
MFLATGDAMLLLSLGGLLGVVLLSAAFRVWW